MNIWNFKYNFTQPYYNNSKYNAQHMVQHEFALDKFEPITDVSEASKYLSKFISRKDNGN